MSEDKTKDAKKTDEKKETDDVEIIVDMHPQFPGMTGWMAEMEGCIQTCGRLMTINEKLAKENSSLKQRNIVLMRQMDYIKNSADLRWKAGTIVLKPTRVQPRAKDEDVAFEAPLAAPGEA
jgi:hypothetical protein